MFQRTYGRESLSADTHDTLLYGQLQERLRMETVHAPAVSGAQSYADLFVVAKSNQHRQTEL